MAYNFKEIEKKWQEKWDIAKLYKTDTLSDKKKIYLLVEFPYPSGAGLHVGHVRSYTAMDVIARKRRAEGFEVLYPIGWDAFGLPAENYAIKTGIHPSITTQENIANFRRELKACGFSFDFEREVDTTDPSYYRWSQWIFLKLYEKGLAYKKKMPVNWCPKDKCVLANEEVVDGKCERCGANAEKRDKEQWMLAITKYAERLDKDLDDTAYLDKIKIQQRNWIGISKGSEINFGIKINTPITFKFEDSFVQDIKDIKKYGTRRIDDKNVAVGDIISLLNKKDQSFITNAIVTKVEKNTLKDLSINYENGTSYSSKDEQIQVYKKYYGDNINLDTIFSTIEFDSKPWNFTIFTTRADTLFGCTYCVLAPEHPLVETLLAQNILTNSEEISKYRDEAKQKIDIDRSAEGREKTGVKLEGVSAINPVNNEEVPIFIADYVLPNYGTGAIMAVPAHDARDYEFAKKYSINIREVISKLFILEGENKERAGVDTLVRNIVDPIIKDGEGNFYLIKETKTGDIHFAGGGVDGEENDEEALRREIIEETGFTDFTLTKRINLLTSVWGYRHTKNKNQRSLGPAYEVTLLSSKRIHSEIEDGDHELLKLKKEEVSSAISWPHHKYIFDFYSKNKEVYEDDGVLVNSGVFGGLTSEEARKKITKHCGGKIVTKSKLRDWVFARQRYWGEPIPIVYNEAGKMYPVAESEFPIVLPNVTKFEPTDNGESPLSLAPEWVNVQGFLNKERHFVSIMNADSLQYNHDEPLDINEGPHNDAYQSSRPIVERANIACIIKHPTEKKYLVAKWKKVDWSGFVTGGIDDKNEVDTAKEEIREETGYKNIKIIEVKEFSSHGLFYHVIKNQNRFAHYKLVVVQLDTLDKEITSNEEQAIADFVWVNEEDVEKTLTRFDMKSLWQYYQTGLFQKELSKKIQKFRRETDTMPQWAGSSWYFMRYIDPHNDLAIGDKDLLAKWLPVNWYNGGMEHTTLHLLYSRFWYKFLFDLGLVPTSEPYYKRTSQGMILGAGGVKMSKSLGNVVNPVETINESGADALRLYEMFIGPFDQAVAWDDKGVTGVKRFLERVDNVAKKVNQEEKELTSHTHRTIKSISEGVESMSFNTCVSTLMIWLNEYEKTGVDMANFKVFLKLLSPFAPYISEELWEELGEKESIHKAPWPIYDETKLVGNVVTISVQMNGKLRGTLDTNINSEENEVREKVEILDFYKKNVEGKEIIKVIFVKNKIINFVVK